MADPISDSEAQAIDDSLKNDDASPDLPTAVEEANESALVAADLFKADALVGLEEVNKEDLPIPTLRLLQKSSDEVVLPDGSRAAPGQFFFPALNKAWNNPEVVFIKAKKVEMVSKYQNNQMVDRWALLGVIPELDNTPFMLFTPVTSNMSAASFVQNVMVSKRPMFSFKVKLESRQIENKKGVFYIISFKNMHPISDLGEYEFLKTIATNFNSRVNLETKEDPDNPSGDIPF